MNLQEPDYLARFQTIIDCCAKSPHTTHLPRVDKELALFDINSLLYIDMLNMYYALCEIFGMNTPSDVMDYMRKVLFTETVTISQGNDIVEKELICVNLIDNNLLLKIHNWLLDYFAHKSDEELLFQQISMNTPAKPYSDLFALDDRISPQCRISDMFPFSFSWDPDQPGGQMGPNQGGGNGVNDRIFVAAPKPRGKQMPARRDPTYDRPFICEFHGCRRAFKRLEHLKRHLKMHTGERPYKCLFPGCQKSFSRSDNLNSHYKTHNIIRKGTFNAYNCGKSFGNF